MLKGWGREKGGLLRLEKILRRGKESKGGKEGITLTEGGI